MPRKAADEVATDLVATLMAGVEKIAAEKVAAQMDELSKKILEKMPEVIALPPPPAEVPLERLLSVGEVAELLGCSTVTVAKRFESGDLAFVLERGSEHRKVPYSWVVEYIHGLPRYTGKLKERKEIGNG